MRTTVTLDDDLAAALQQLARERGLPFKDVLNGAVRRGLDEGTATKPYRVPARPLGVRPGIDLDKALAIAAQFEDEEILRKLDLRK